MDLYATKQLNLSEKPAKKNQKKNKGKNKERKRQLDLETIRDLWICISTLPSK